MGQCQKDVTPVRYQWSYVFLASTHRTESLNAHVPYIKILKLGKVNKAYIDQFMRLS